MAAAPQGAPNSTLPTRLAQLARSREQRFLGKDEVIRLMLVASIAGEHAVLIGPPGTAKSALIRMFARLLQARYFEYLLTRFTEPNEIFGPVDLAAFREGRYERRTEGMLPDAESWIVHDRGVDDLRLYAAANGRTAYVFDEATGAFHEAKP